MNIKKILAFIVSMAMLVPVATTIADTIYDDNIIVANAEDDIQYSGSCGENCTYSFDDTTGTLTISGTGDMEDYSYSSRSPWYSYKDDIKVVIIEDGVTSIGDCAFYFCVSLKSISIPDSVTSIGADTFEFCTSLKEVTIPTSITTIGSAAFNGCDSLTEVIIPNSVTEVGNGAFNSCVSLTEVTISNSVTEIEENVFNSCTSLTKVTIPDSVTKIYQNAFCNCKSLIEVIISNSVTEIDDNAFLGCTSLTAMTVDENNQNYASIDGVLFNKDITELIQYPAKRIGTSYSISDSVTSINICAFWYCTSLASVTIPSSVTSIAYGAFYNCTSLTSVTIPDSVTSIDGEAFFDCTSLKEVIIPDSVTSIGYHAFGYYSDDDGYNLSKVEGFTIYGVSGSAAETYALENDFTFIEITDDSSEDPYANCIFDVNQDGDVKTNDLLLLKKRLLGLI
ncbi:MAG: leucine-rich repeat domain-containing protein [Ruminococcus sp.]|nr:leucine-rich repeat domain-containing protein [Ruminococcus sp.]